ENAPTADFAWTGTAPTVLDLVMGVNLFPSKSEARRMIAQGGVTIDDVKMTDALETVNVAPGASVMVKRGKKTHLKVNIK
ncbi:MAG: tyrosine--tRNA ligase, partial [Alphaproteobacteria bacterium]|nr:tyrosine--tRNA ligase [Alphaproteobacteria bacterium]